MKDYSFGDLEYKKRFIMHYKEEENGRYLVAKLANGTKEVYDNNIRNEQIILNRMRSQIEIADQKVHGETIDYTATRFLAYLKNYLMVQSKIKDIEKNKLILENAEYINKALVYGKRWALGLPLYLQDRLIWDFCGWYTPITLNNADKYTLGEIQAILYNIDHYRGFDKHFPRRYLVKKEETLF